METATKLHAMWANVAPAWREHAAFADARGAEVASRLLALTQPVPGERVLELACGPGGLGLAAATRVGAGGEVVMSDVAAEMVAIAAERAGELGLTNVSTRVLDIEAIDEPDESYDVVLCREGLMFATDPRRALSEIRRVLRPGGRLGVAVWDARERNPWLSVVFDAVGAVLDRPVPPPGLPNPFTLGDAERLDSLLREAGLKDVGVSDIVVPLRAGSFDEWWRRTSALAGPLAAIVASLPEPAARAIRDRARDAAAAYETPTGIEFPGVALIATARGA
jgi:enediyne biosynthesis protein CalE5